MRVQLLLLLSTTAACWNVIWADYININLSSQFTDNTIRRLNSVGSLGSSPHITGGSEVKPHSVPYQVALFDHNRFFCGGSLIGTRWALTAAHCGVHKFPNINITHIVAGAHNTVEDAVSVQKIPVEEIYIHPDYQDDIMGNDVALLHLQYSANIDTAPSPVLRSVDTRVLWNFYCRLRFKLGNIPFNGATHLCTSGWGPKGGCYGDSGGPLTTVDSEGVPTLIGVASYIYAVNCDSWGPTAFTRITTYLDWIQSKTGIKARP